MLEKLVTKNRKGDRNDSVFHCSDYGKSSADLFLRMTGVAETNPPEWYDKLKWGAGLGVEKEMLQVLKDSQIVPEEYDQDTHGVIESEVRGMVVSGHMDGNTSLDKTGIPIEIKSINNKNAWDIKSYEENNPRKNYVGQLSMYMYLTKQKKGYLFVASIDGLNRFFFECNEIGDGIYQCGNTVVDLNEEFDRWEKIYKHVSNGSAMPDELLWEYRYKIPVDEIDWKTVSANDISKARNGHKVIGDWNVLYSNYKDLIVGLQGERVGYSPEELEIIKEKTTGYTSWNK